MSDKPYSMKGETIRLIRQGNPKQRLKAVEWGAYGEVRRVEWYDEDTEQAATGEDSQATRERES